LPVENSRILPVVVTYHHLQYSIKGLSRSNQVVSNEWMSRNKSPS
jgi:hypothetical protein